MRLQKANGAVRCDFADVTDRSVGLDPKVRISVERFENVEHGLDGAGFYLWEFAGEDKALSIDKWEGAPFQAYMSEVLSPDSFTVYKR